MLSPNLSIVDDPTAKDGAGKALIGGYKIDDEGVAAQRVEVVKDGMLEDAADQPHAVGEGPDLERPRAAHRRRRRVPRQRDEPVRHRARAACRARRSSRSCVAAARAEGLKYGLVIRRFDDAAITGAPEFTRRELVQMIKATDQQLPPPAALAYRVYPNGKEELVRGVQLAEVPIRAWKDVHRRRAPS